MTLFKTNKTYYLAILLLAQLFIGWGYKGHELINGNAVLSFPQEMSPFVEWAGFLAEHGSDADRRKSSDPTEGHKHYIDLDNYDEFNETGQISQNFDSLVIIHGQTFVDKQGILPWTILAAMDSLEAAFNDLRFENAKQFAADLGHYVGDAHMPLHLTRNYDGQYTNQRGIHSRYESRMIGDYVDQIVFATETAEYVNNVPEFVFGFIYDNYEYMNPLLLADAEATNRTGSTSSNDYYEVLWNETKNFTIPLFKSASNKLATLIYTAWVNAGKPLPVAASIAVHEKPVESFHLAQNYPNPFNPSTTIGYSLEKPGFVKIEIHDIVGRRIKILENHYKSAGKHQITWYAGNQPAGIYFYSIETQHFKDIKSMTLIK